MTLHDSTPRTRLKSFAHSLIRSGSGAALDSPTGDPRPQSARPGRFHVNHPHRLQLVPDELDDDEDDDVIEWDAVDDGVVLTSTS